LTGTRPFGRDSPTAEAAAHVYEHTPSARAQNPALPIAVDAVFDRVLAKRPDDRFASCDAFAAALRGACTSRADAVTQRIAPVPRLDRPTLVKRRRRRTPVLIATGATLAVLAGAIAAAFLGTDGPPAKPSLKQAVVRTTTPAPPTKKTPVKAPVVVSTQADASDLNTQGYRLLLAGQYSAALPLLQRAVAGLTDPANPVTAYANFNLGQTLVRLSRCNEAVPYLQRALQLEPSSQQVVDAIGYARQCAGALAAPATGASFTPGHGGNSGRRADHRHHAAGRD
jgi:tetratricopeptide (TPR) repeat protein